MSYYFVIIGTQDNPLFEYEFGTAKQGGDGIARFPEQARHMNQFIVHSSLDIVEEVQWGNGQMYVGSAALDLHLLTVSEVSQVHRSVLQQLRLLLDDGGQYVSHPTFLPRSPTTDTNETDIKFLLLHAPSQPASSNPSRASTSIGANPTSPQTEEAIKQFFTEVYENWVKTIMSPFYQVNMEVRSPVFRSRVAAAGKKYL
jgi:hypothetical protein